MPDWLEFVFFVVGYFALMRWILPASACLPEWRTHAVSSLDTNKVGQRGGRRRTCRTAP